MSFLIKRVELFIYMQLLNSTICLNFYLYYNLIIAILKKFKSWIITLYVPIYKYYCVDIKEY